ncbi:MAG: CPBP family intramembrane metalloprotease [Chloroflexi bacterium]|nr:CPBP family intramembrane metalloprotease [Chloroflexota bacterium]
MQLSKIPHYRLIKNILIFIITIIWIYTIIARFMPAFGEVGKITQDRVILATDIYLRFSNLPDSIEDPELKKTLTTVLSGMLDKELEEVRENKALDTQAASPPKKVTNKSQDRAGDLHSKIIQIALTIYKNQDIGKAGAGYFCRLAILENELGNKQEAAAALNEEPVIKEKPECRKLMLPLIQTGRLPDGMKPEDAKNIIGMNYNGWFRDTGMEMVLAAAGDKSGLAALKDAERKEAYKFFINLALLGMLLFLGFFLGLLGVILLPLLTKWLGGTFTAPQWPLIDAWGVFLVIFFLRNWLFELVNYVVSSSLLITLLIAYIPVSILLISIVLYFVRAYGGKIKELGIGLMHPKSLFLGPIGFICAIFTVASLSLVNLYIAKAPNVSTNPILEQVITNMNTYEMVFLFILVGVLAPAFEEFLFRGFLLGSIRSAWGRWPAILLSAVIFSLMHADPAGILPIIGIGVLLGYLYDRTGSLWVAIITHAMWNSMVFLLARFFYGMA